jgi:hypothetical protein
MNLLLGLEEKISFSKLRNDASIVTEITNANINDMTRMPKQIVNCSNSL